MQINSVSNTSFGLKFDFIIDKIFQTAIEQDARQACEVEGLRNSFSDKYCLFALPTRFKGTDNYDIYIGLSKNPQKNAYVSSIDSINPNGLDGRKLGNMSYVLKLMKKNKQIPKK